ncbi:putative ribonuclease H-like domain-containing protein [Tanacetum coccineum]
MRKSMLKQEFSDFKVTESEGLHKGYDRFQKILSQLNQMQAKPDNEDCNMKFLRALPPSWSQVAITLKTKGGLDYLSFDDLYNKLRTLEIDVKGGSSYDSRGTSAPTHSAFVSAASTNSKMTYPDQSHSTTFTTASSIPAASSNVIESVLHSFVAESDPQQQITYEDFDQIGKIDLEELDIKWQMAMLSIRINRFEKKAGRKFKFNNKDAARFDKKKVQIKELDKIRRTKRLSGVSDSMLNWSDHESEDMEKGASEVYGMIAGYGGIMGVSVTSSDATDAETQFALMGLSPQVQSCPFGCNYTYTELKKDFDNLEVQYKECFIQVQAYKSSLQNLEQQKSWYQNNQLALEEKIRILTADLGNTTNMLKYTEKLNEQAKIDNMNNKVKLEESEARFDKWKNSSKNLNKLINSSMSSRSKFGLGYGDTFGTDEVFDLSAPSIFDSCLKDAIEKPLYDGFVKAGGLHAIPGPITGLFHCSLPTSLALMIHSLPYLCDKSSDSETTDFASCVSSVKSSSSKTNEPLASAPSSVDFKPVSKTADQQSNSTNADSSFSFKENVKPPRNLCNKSGINSRSLCKRKSFGSKTCFVCGSKFHLIKDCDFYEKQLELHNKPMWTNVANIPSFVPKAASVPAGSRNRPSSVPAGSRNRPTSVPAGSRNRPTSVPAGRTFSAGWKNNAARPMTRPTSHYFQHFHRPGFYNQMSMDEGRWGTAENPHKNRDLGIVDSGCSRSMTGNKEKLDDFVKIIGGTVTFGGGDGKITGKGTIRTSKLNFENVYYVEELQNFNLFSVSQICDTKNKVLFTDKECLVLSKEFQLPENSQVVLRVPRRNNLYCFNLSDIKPERGVTCLLAKASLEESTKWHRRMAHVNFKNMNKLAKHGLVNGLPSKLFTNEHNCVACNKGKQHKASYKAITAVSTISAPLQLLHMDLFGPTSIRSIDHKYYSLVVTDDFSRSCQLVGIWFFPCCKNCSAAGVYDGPTETSAPVFKHVHTDATSHPPGHSLGSSASFLQDTLFSSPSDLANSIWLILFPTKEVNIFISNQRYLEISLHLSDKSSVAQALNDPAWVEAMQEDSNIIINQSMGSFVPLPNGKLALGTNGDLKQKRLPEAYAFLYGEIEEEVYVTQPKGFEDPHFLKSMFTSCESFFMVFINHQGSVQVYVDDIIFGSTNKAWCDDFEVLIKGEFKMSAMGELTFFLDLQVKQKPEGNLLITKTNYVQDMLKKFDIESVRPATTPFEASKPKSKDKPDEAVNVHLYRSMIVKKRIFKYLKGQPKLGPMVPKILTFNVEAISDSDYAGSHGDRKSTTGGCQFLGRRLISWQCKKQTINATLPLKHNMFMRLLTLWSVPTGTLLVPTGRTIPTVFSKSGSWDQFGSQVAIALICLTEGRRFLQMILEIEPRKTKQYHAFKLTRKMFANMRLNFQGDHMPILGTMLPPAQAAIAGES